jgi:lipopolysaccharide export system permease protein
LFYQLNKYENKNELLIFWINGVKKKQFINIIIVYSILITILQIFLGGYVSPFSQNEARSFIRNSNVDFFPSLIKEGKFIDTVSNLTIFIESRSVNGEYKNIFLKELISEENEKNKFQIIHAKKGVLISDDKNRYFQLHDGEILNKEGNKIKSFNFDKINFNLSKYGSKTTGYPKIQEVPSYDLYNCLKLNYKKQINLFKAEYLQCRVESINDIKPIVNHTETDTEIRNHIGMDLPGRYPVTSTTGNKYIFVMYDYDTGYIKTVAMKSRETKEILRCFNLFKCAI